jgi:oligopeptide transport system permease protein
VIRFMFRRLAQSVPTLLAVVTVSFFLMRLAPGGPFDLERPLAPAATSRRSRRATSARPSRSATRASST